MSYRRRCIQGVYEIALEEEGTSLLTRKPVTRRLVSKGRLRLHHATNPHRHQSGLCVVCVCGRLINTRCYPKWKKFTNLESVLFLRRPLAHRTALRPTTH